jgi:hypothetical protein
VIPSCIDSIPTEDLQIQHLQKLLPDPIPLKIQLPTSNV